MGQNWGRFTPYTPTIAGSTTDPVLGTGSTASGRWRAHGTRCYGYMEIVWGGSPTAGSGYYGFLLPMEPLNANQGVGTGFIIDTSDNNRVCVAAAAVVPVFFSSASTRAVLFTTNGAGEGVSTGNNPVGASSPFAPAAGDQIYIAFDFETA